jgi:hypothetical protein
MRRFALSLLILLGGLAPVGAARAAPSISISATYEARLLIKVADLHEEETVSAQGFHASARLTTIGALGVIKSSSLTADASGGVADSAPAPAPVSYVQIEKNKRRDTHFAPGGGPRSVADPLTQLLRAALQPAAGSPCLGTVPVYDGRQRYDLTLSPAGGGTLSGPPAHFGLTHPVACRLGFRPISGFSAGAARKNPFVRSDPVATFAYEPRAKVWLMTDIAVPTLVGTGHIALTAVHINGVRPDLSATAAAPPPKVKPRRKR